MQQFDFIYDFASPNAYVVHRLIPGIEARTGAKARYLPVYLGGIFKATGNQSPALAGVSGKAAYLLREIDRFVGRHKIAYQFSPHFPLHTIHLMRGAVYARGQPWQAGFIEAMFRACWSEGANMSDLAVIAEVLRAEGLPADEIIKAVQTPEVKAELFATTDAAVQRGVFGVPTMFVGDEMFFGKQVLEELEAEIVAARRR